MKNYLNRLSAECPKRRFVFWWIFRLLMLYAFIMGFFRDPFDITDPLQVGANIVCMFIWEIFMLFPEKSILRHIPSVVQSFLIVGIFAASFGGKYLNFYYDVGWWDTVLHFIGGAACVFFGYEIACAILKREKKIAPVSLVLLAAVGFSFIAATGWELFEFSFDQIAGMMGGTPGDAQHWSWALAQGTPKIDTLFNPIDQSRWPLMDTMGDIVLNTVGALGAYVFLRIYPYRHKGKFKLELPEEKQVEMAS